MQVDTVTGPEIPDVRPGARITLIVNPASTRARQGLGRDAELLLAAHGLEEVLETRAHGGAEALAGEAATAGATLVVTVGGDGTVNQVAAALAGTPVALVPLPAGSTNVFTRALGWPKGGAEALAVLDRLLAEGREPEEIVLGRLRAEGIDRPFSMNVGVGVDAETVDIIETRPWLKHRLRHLGFALATIVAERRLARGPGLEISVDGAPAIHVGAVAVACGSPYAFVGPLAFDLAPGARHDGTLAWIAVERVRALGVAAASLGAARGGRHVRSAKVLHGTGAREIALTAAEPFALQSDGEALGRHTWATLTTGPTLRVLRP